MDKLKFYTDKNNYFTFIAPDGFDSKKEFPQDPRSKVIFTKHLPEKNKAMQLVIIAYLVDNPRSLDSLKSFINDRFALLKKNKDCKTYPIQKYVIAKTTCLRSEIFLTKEKTKTLVVLGYPRKKLCLDITFTAPLSVYYDYLPKILESLETLIIIKGINSEDKKVFDAQQVIWQKKDVAFLIAENKFDQAKELLEKLLDKEPDNSHLNFQMGLVYQHLNLSMSAISQFKKTLELEPYYWKSFVQLGIISIDEGDFKKAKGYFEQALKISPDSFEAKSNLAAIYRQIGNIQKSAKIYEELLVDHPNNPIILFNIGRLFVDAGNFKEAKKYFIKVLKIERNSTPAMVNLGGCHLALKEYNKAEKMAKQALMIDSALLEANNIINEIRKNKLK